MCRTKLGPRDAPRHQILEVGAAPRARFRYGSVASAVRLLLAAVRRVGQSTAAGSDRLPARREPSPPGGARIPTRTFHRRPAPPPRRQREVLGRRRLASVAGIVTPDTILRWIGAVSEFVAHYHRERNHQGLDNALIEGAALTGAGRVRRQSRLGGLLNFYTRAA